jgi:hypothetical protein
MKGYTGPSHLVIPDTQAKPGVPLEHMVWAARLALQYKPTRVIHLGDNWDFPSLSTYRTAVEKAVDQDDIEGEIEAGNECLRLFDDEIRAHNRKQKARERYKPERHYTWGNHDVRLLRLLAQIPWFRKTLGPERLGLKLWKQHPFLVPFDLDGVRYCHFFPRAADGLVKQTKRGAPSPKAQIQREGMSCTAGHQQGLKIFMQPFAGGQRRAIVAGSFYQHEEDYLKMGNNHWRGVLLKREVRGGDYDLQEFSMATLRRLYS